MHREVWDRDFNSKWNTSVLSPRGKNSLTASITAKSIQSCMPVSSRMRKRVEECVTLQFKKSYVGWLHVSQRLVASYYKGTLVGGWELAKTKTKKNIYIRKKEKGMFFHEKLLCDSIFTKKMESRNLLACILKESHPKRAEGRRWSYSCIKGAGTSVWSLWWILQRKWIHCLRECVCGKHRMPRYINLLQFVLFVYGPEPLPHMHIIREVKCESMPELKMFETKTIWKSL